MLEPTPGITATDHTEAEVEEDEAEEAEDKGHQKDNRSVDPAEEQTTQEPIAAFVSCDAGSVESEDTSLAHASQQMRQRVTVIINLVQRTRELQIQTL